MSLNETIIKRKAIRNYIDTPLNTDQLSRIYDCINKISPIIPDLSYQIKIVDREEFNDKFKGLFMVKAPHYLVISGDKSEKGLLNIGYVAQNLVLGLTANNLGTCYLGGVKPRNNAEENFIIAVAFGNSDEEFRKDETEAKRVTLSELVSGEGSAHAVAMRAARLAPSGMNWQPARYLASDSHTLHVFNKNKGVLADLKFFYKLSSLDCGIAIANIMAACPSYEFEILQNPPTLAGTIYVATLTLKD